MCLWPTAFRLGYSFYSKKPMQIRPYDIGIGLLLFVLYFGSFLLPDVHISQETSTFQLHFVGGGIVSFVIYSHIKHVLGLKPIWWRDIAALYSFVSALGVANELLEFAITKLGIVQISGTDVWWDLAANTSGAFCGLVIYKVVGYLMKTMSI